MARQTASQRQAEQLAYRQSQRDQAQASYPAHLMKILESASDEYSMELLVRNGQFMVQHRDHRDVWVLSLEYTDGVEDILADLEYALDRLRQQREQAQQLHNLQQQARAKLTPEELRALLGL